MGTSQKSHEFIRSMFAEYYRGPFSLSVPPNVERREFGFLSLSQKGMMRHISFGSERELKSFLEKSVPSDAYVSCAYYEEPEAEMDKKGWLGADLIFDIDADHIPTPCGKAHDEWECGNCHSAGKGPAPERCPKCGSEKLETRIWPCNVCLDSAKAETVKLLDMLTKDFGFSEEELYVFFSGHRGYHVHVESEAVKSVDAIGRKEIVDYVCGLGLETAFHGLDVVDGKLLLASRNLGLKELGWRGRVAKCMHDLLSAEEKCTTIGLDDGPAKAIIVSREAILKGWCDHGLWSAVKGVSPKTMQRMVKHCIDSQSARIDTVVTTDIHRLIRLADSLHSKTGLKKVEFPLSEIDSFDPFKSAVVFRGGDISVSVSSSPEFTLGDETFGPYTDQKVNVPAAVAVFLVCKGRAEVAE